MFAGSRLLLPVSTNFVTNTNYIMTTYLKKNPNNVHVIALSESYFILPKINMFYYRKKKGGGGVVRLITSV